MTREELTKLYDGYLDGVLDPSVRLELEQVMMEGVETEEERHRVREMIAVLKGAIFKHQLKEYHKEYLRKRPSQSPEEDDEDIAEA
jgi:predicted signal transduction protein with EAL and GGDEF domain